MSACTNEEVSKLGGAEELELASLQSDGTLRKPVTIWVVRHGDGLYVRPIYGRDTGWYRGVRERHAGRVQAGGVAREATFEEADAAPALNDHIDAAYRAKYRRHAKSIVDTVRSRQARAATLKLTPRE
jgi:hypothetical protein